MENQHVKNVSPWSQILSSYCAEFGISSEVTPGKIFNQKGRPRTLSILAKINKMPASQKLTYNILKVIGSKTLDQGSPSPSFVFHQFKDFFKHHSKTNFHCFGDCVNATVNPQVWIIPYNCYTALITVHDLWTSICLRFVIAFRLSSCE